MISDGNDTNSRSDLAGASASRFASRTRWSTRLRLMRRCHPKQPTAQGRGESRLQQRGRPPRTFPFPMPGRRPPPRTPPIPGVPAPSSPRPPSNREPGRARAIRCDRACKEPVNLSALRQITDDSGGFTELVRDTHDLESDDGRIADELEQAGTYLGYPSRGDHDGRWHAIRVEVRDPQRCMRAGSPRLHPLAR